MPKCEFSLNEKRKGVFCFGMNSLTNSLEAFLSMVGNLSNSYRHHDGCKTNATSGKNRTLWHNANLNNNQLLEPSSHKAVVTGWCLAL